MATLKIQKEIKLIDETLSKGSSRVYKFNKSEASRHEFYQVKGNKERVMNYIFGTAELPEEIDNIIADEKKNEPIQDNGYYVYTKEEIDKYGTPSGNNYVIKVEEDKEDE